MYRKESDQTMAIGPEQLDLKKLAKFFILDGDLESKITKEMIKAILETFEPDDWMYIKPNFDEVSTAKANLRDLIRQCEIFLGAMSYSVNRGRGQFLTSTYVKLKEAVRVAKDIYKLEGDELAVIATDSLRQIFVSVAYELIKDDDIEAEKWFSNNDYYGRLDWVPYKKFIFDRNSDSCLFVYPKELVEEGIQLPWEKEALIVPYSIDGIYVEYMDGNEPKHAIITRTNTITLNNGDVKPLDQLGGELEDVIIIDGSLSLAMGLLFIDMGYVYNSNVDFGSVLSAYLGRPVNVVPVKFGCDCSEVVAEAYVVRLLEEAELFKYNEVSEKYEVTDKGVEVLKLQKDELVVTTISPIPDKDILHVTGYTINSDERIYIDNSHRLISGVSDINADHIRLFMSNRFKFLKDENDKLILTPAGNSKVIQVKNVKNGEFAVVDTELLVDRNAIFTDGKYISKYRHFYVPTEGSVEREWIPAVIVGDYYVSPEPIDPQLRLYKENSEFKQVIGIIDEAQNILYTRMSEFVEMVPAKRALDVAEKALKEANDILAEARKNKKATQEMVDNIKAAEKERAVKFGEYAKFADKHPLTNTRGQYQLRPEELGYYNGQLFCEKAMFEGDNHKFYISLIEYIKHMEAFKELDGDFVDLSKNKIIVDSKFNPIYINTHKTGSFYWEGDAADIVHLPDTKDECLTYLNIAGFKSKPSSIEE